MNRVHNTIIILLLISVLGFFANWAQNDYGGLIINLCFILIAILFNYKAHQEIKAYKFWNSLFYVTYIFYFLGFMITIAESGGLLFLFDLPFTDYVFASFYLLLLFFILLFPIILYFLKKKNRKDGSTFNYIEAYSISLFFWGLTAIITPDINETMDLFISTSLFLAFLLLIKGIRLLLKSIKESSLIKFVDFLLYLLSVVFILSFVATYMNWPGVMILRRVFYIIIIVAFLVIQILISRKEYAQLIELWKTMKWVRKFSLSGILVLMSYYLLLGYGLAPELYNNSMPLAYKKLKANANEITPLGRSYSIRAETYKKNFQAFFEQVDENKKIQHVVVRINTGEN